MTSPAFQPDPGAHHPAAQAYSPERQIPPAKHLRDAGLHYSSPSPRSLRVSMDWLCRGLVIACLGVMLFTGGQEGLAGVECDATSECAGASGRKPRVSQSRQPLDVTELLVRNQLELLLNELRDADLVARRELGREDRLVSAETQRLGTDAPEGSNSQSRRHRLLRAKERAAGYFASQVTTVNPSWLPIFAYLKRRFGAVFETAGGAVLHELPESVERPEIFHVFKRLMSPSASVDAAVIESLPTIIDRIAAASLHCATHRLPDDWLQVLGALTHEGLYALTHAAMATRWTVENGCLLQEQVEPLRILQVELLERMLGARETLAMQIRSSDDLWIEAMAMMYYLGERERVRAEWIDLILDLQCADGGWSIHPRSGTSHPHPTALALWIIFENLNPDASLVPLVPQE